MTLTSIGRIPSIRSNLTEHTGVAAVVLLVLATAVYVNTLHNPFVFDDTREIVENASIVTLADIPTILRHSRTRPVTNLSYAVDYARSGLDSIAYHVTNVILHAANVLLLFLLMRQVARDVGATPQSINPGSSLGAFAGAAIFAVHPMMTEAVGYISGRAEVLAATFFLASFSCFRHSLRGGTREVWAAAAGLVLFITGLGAKETVIALPAVLLLYDALANRGRSPWRRRLAYVHLPLFLIVLVLAVARVWFYLAVEQSEAARFSWHNLVIELHVLERYLQLMVFPYPQSLVHRVAPITSPLDIRLITAAVVLAVTLQAAWMSRYRAPLVTLGIGWWYFVHVPSAALIVIADTGQALAEHRVYLASCGLFVAGVGAIQIVHRPAMLLMPRVQLAATAALILAVGVLSGLTIARNRVWSTPVSLWEDAARKAPRTLSAQQFAGDAHRTAGNCESAIVFYRRAIDLRSDYADTNYGLAECAIELRRPRDAEIARQGLQKVIRQRPRDARPRLMLSRLEERIFNRPAEALRLCREAASLAPEMPAALSCVRRLETVEKSNSR